MLVNVPRFEIIQDGCSPSWIWNLCVQHSWWERRPEQVVVDENHLIPRPVDFCLGVSCCCDDEHDDSPIAPIVTGAPWFDRYTAASAEYFGLLPETVVIAPIAEAEGSGWEIAVTATAIASTPRGLAYGLSWLERITSSCSSVRWRNDCPGEPLNIDVLNDDGWRSACGLRRTGLITVDHSRDARHVCQSLVTFTLSSGSCITGTTIGCTKPLELTIGDPVSRELCGSPMEPVVPRPSWIKARSTSYSMRQGRWAEPWNVFPARTVISPVVGVGSGVAFEVKINTPTTELYNLRLDIFAVDPDEEFEVGVNDIYDSRRIWTALIPEVPAGTELAIGSPCGMAEARYDGTTVDARTWVRSGSDGPFSAAPVAWAEKCPQRFVLAAWASAEAGPDGCLVTPCDASITVAIKPAFRVRV